MNTKTITLDYETAQKILEDLWSLRKERPPHVVDLDKACSQHYEDYNKLLDREHGTAFFDQQNRHWRWTLGTSTIWCQEAHAKDIYSIDVGTLLCRHYGSAHPRKLTEEEQTFYKDLIDKAKSHVSGKRGIAEQTEEQKLAQHMSQLAPGMLWTIEDVWFGGNPCKLIKGVSRSGASIGSVVITHEGVVVLMPPFDLDRTISLKVAGFNVIGE
jgi:hypothetical protein